MHKTSLLVSNFLLGAFFVAMNAVHAKPLPTYIGVDPRSGKGCSIKLNMELSNTHGNNWATVTGPAYQNTRGQIKAIGERTMTNTSSYLNGYDGREFCIYREPSLLKVEHGQHVSLLHVCVKFGWSNRPVSARVQVTPVRVNLYGGRGMFSETLPTEFSRPFTEMQCEGLKELK